MKRRDSAPEEELGERLQELAHADRVCLWLFWRGWPLQRKARRRRRRRSCRAPAWKGSPNIASSWNITSPSGFSFRNASVSAEAPFERLRLLLTELVAVRTRPFQRNLQPAKLFGHRAMPMSTAKTFLVSRLELLQRQ
jgi:hypothetical protein